MPIGAWWLYTYLQCCHQLVLLFILCYNIILFNTVQHTSDHSGELPYTYPETVYAGSKVELPTMIYPGPGSLQTFVSASSTENGTPRYVVNDKYWYAAGQIWATSDGTYAKASPIADVIANIASLTASDTLNIDIVFEDSNSQS